MVEIVEQSCGFLVCADRFRETFQCKVNALIAARILATAEAVMSNRDVGVWVPMGHGEVVCMDVMALA